MVADAGLSDEPVRLIPAAYIGQHMHSIVWFWTTGIHDPTWVQAVASVVLVVLTILTLAVLAVYTRDTHTLAKVSVKQIALALEERSVSLARQNHAAFDSVMKARDDVEAIGRSLIDGTFGTKPQPPIYPDNWPDVTSALGQRKTSMYLLMASLGVDLREVDSAVKSFFDASDNNEKILHEGLVCKAVEQAVEGCKGVLAELREIGKE
jgi:hypothetical protein